MRIQKQKKNRIRKENLNEPINRRDLFEKKETIDVKSRNKTLHKQKEGIFKQGFELLKKMSRTEGIEVAEQIKPEEINTDGLSQTPVIDPSSPVSNTINYFKRMWSFYEVTNIGEKDKKHITGLLNSDTSLRESKDNFDAKCFGGITGNGTGQAESFGCMLPEIALLQQRIQTNNLDDLGVVGFVKGLNPTL